MENFIQTGTLPALDNYADFLSGKVRVHTASGFEVEPDQLRPGTLPHQPDIIRWLLRKGKALLGASFGLTKTYCQCEVLRLIHETDGGKVLFICPLGVRSQFIQVDGPRAGIDIRYVGTTAEAEACDTPYLITNYERVRDGQISPEFLKTLTAVTLDEGSVLKSLGAKTTQVFIKLFRDTKYKYIATATPSPNNTVELVHYAEFLGVMDAGQILSRWFKRDSVKAHNSSLHPQHEEDFWLWVSSWALFLTRPSDLGYSDEGYDLPDLKVTWHRISTASAEAAKIDKFGQGAMFNDVGGKLSEAAAVKRESIDRRVQHAARLVAEAEPDRHWLLWHHQEKERLALSETIPGTVAVYGSQPLEQREEFIMGFSRGEFPILATKPSIAGSGCNFQRFCYSNIFVGINYEFEDFIQALHRTHRFQQPHQVEVHIIYLDTEESIRKSLERKWKLHEDLQARMREIIQKFGLHHGEELRRINRNMGVEREEVSGENFTLVYNDNVLEVSALPDNYMDLWLTSIPFHKQFEYTANYCDFGHNEDPEAFFAQMDFLTPQMLRTLQPGRNLVVHVKDNVEYGNVTGLGMTSVYPFHADCIKHYIKHGFIYMGMITVVTDVVRENAQTYRLGWSEQCKDGSKMSVGLPEYLLIFRKLPTDRANAYADVRVEKDKADYSRGRWQLDAHSMWRSSGDRLLRPSEVANMSHSSILKWFQKRNLAAVYDYEEHVKIHEQIEEAQRLPSSFMLCAPQSTHPDVWSDVTYVQTLNSRQTQKRQQNHVCPLPLDIVRRAIRRWSNEGERVGDPFGGIMTVPVISIQEKRKAWASELNRGYFGDGVVYCQEAEYKNSIPTLFDFLKEEVQL